MIEEKGPIEVRISKIREALSEARSALVWNLPEGRERALALTSLEQSAQWAEASLGFGLRLTEKE